MTSVGVSAYLADNWLNTLNNVPFVVPTTYFQLHTGIPGAAGTTDVSATTLRVSGSFAAAANGTFTFTGIPPIWASVSAAETITDISAWDAATNGNFLFSGALLVPKTVAIGDQLALGAFSLTFTALAA